MLVETVAGKEDDKHQTVMYKLAKKINDLFVQNWIKMIMQAHIFDLTPKQIVYDISGEEQILPKTKSELENDQVVNSQIEQDFDDEDLVNEDQDFSLSASNIITPNSSQLV